MQVREEGGCLEVTWRRPRREVIVTVVFVVLGLYASGALHFLFALVLTRPGDSPSSADLHSAAGGGRAAEQLWSLWATWTRAWTQPEHWPRLFMQMVFGILLIGCGVAFSTTEGSRIERCVIDKHKATVRFESTSLLPSFIFWSRGHHSRRREVVQDLGTLDAIQIESVRSASAAANASKRPPSRVRLVFCEGSVALPLTQAYHIDRAHQIEIAERIRRFVGRDDVEVEILDDHSFEKED